MGRREFLVTNERIQPLNVPPVLLHRKIRHVHKPMLRRWTPLPSMTIRKRILIIDDDLEATHTLRRLLEHGDYEVEEENNSECALDHARLFQPHSVILDYLMPKVNGGDVAWQLASDPVLKSTQVIICSGISKAEIAIHLPPSRIPILEKPVDSEVLLALLRSR